MQITAHLFITRFDVCVRPLFVLWSFSAYDLLLKEETKTHDCMLVRSSSFDDNYDRVMRFRFFRSQQPMTDQRDPYAITSSNKLSAATWNGESCEVFSIYYAEANALFKLSVQMRHEDRICAAIQPERCERRGVNAIQSRWPLAVGSYTRNMLTIQLNLFRKCSGTTTVN